MDRYTGKKLTKQRRQHQTCRVYELKLDRSTLSVHAIKHLSNLFKETKWFYNYCLGLEDVNEANTKARSVPVKVGEAFEERSLIALSSQMKQAVKTRLFNSMSSLKVLKAKGYKIGKLKFKRHIDSIPLKQLGTAKHSGTHYIDRQRSRIRIQGLDKWLKVRGMNQLPIDCEIANANLIRKANDFFLNVTTYTERALRNIPEEAIGIDFGCETQLTLSNGIKIDFQVSPTKRLRRLDRKLHRHKRPDSKNKFKDRLKRQKEYQRVTNQKADIRHKLVHAITNSYKYVCFQDESIHAWHAGNHGKKIQHSGIGGILSDLKHKSVTPLEVDKFFPSTQLCPVCGQKTKLSLDQRVYECQCGFRCDRDIKSAFCIKQEALERLNRVPTDRREFTLGESPSSTFFDRLKQINGIQVSKLDSLSQEAAGQAQR